jgi:hypothetical protein
MRKRTNIALLTAIVTVAFNVGACGSDTCKVEVRGHWLDPQTYCPTGEQVVGCSGEGASLGGACYIYVPTNTPVVVNQTQPPRGNAEFPGEWRVCTDAEYMKAFNTGNTCTPADGGSDGSVD